MALARLERLQQFTDDHFGHDSGADHGGHVGDLVANLEAALLNCF